MHRGAASEPARADVGVVAGAMQEPHPAGLGERRIHAGDDGIQHLQPAERADVGACAIGVAFESAQIPVGNPVLQARLRMH